MPNKCIVCRNHERECTCIERQTLNRPEAGAVVRDWEREGFRFVNYRLSAANEDDEYLVYRKHSDSAELGKPVRVR